MHTRATDSEFVRPCSFVAVGCWLRRRRNAEGVIANLARNAFENSADEANPHASASSVIVFSEPPRPKSNAARSMRRRA